MRYVNIIMAVLFIKIASSLGFASISGACTLFIGLWFLYRSFRRKAKFKPKVKLASGNKQLDEFHTQLFNKAVTDYNTLELEIKTIQDKSFRKQLDKMQGIAKNFLTYLQEHPDRIGLATRFVDYYQDRAILLVRKYKELDRTGLQEPSVVQSKREIVQLLHNYDEAYSDQFSKVLNAQLLDLDAEMKVMKENMTADGITPDTPEEPKPVAKKEDNKIVNSLIELSDKFLNKK